MKFQRQGGVWLARFEWFITPAVTKKLNPQSGEIGESGQNGVLITLKTIAYLFLIYRLDNKLLILGKAVIIDYKCTYKYIFI